MVCVCGVCVVCVCGLCVCGMYVVCVCVVCVWCVYMWCVSMWCVCVVCVSVCGVCVCVGCINSLPSSLVPSSCEGFLGLFLSSRGSGRGGEQERRQRWETLWRVSVAEIDCVQANRAEREKFEQGPCKCSAGNIPAVLRTGENDLQIWTSPGREGCSGMDEGQS